MSQMVDDHSHKSLDMALYEIRVLLFIYFIFIVIFKIFFYLNLVRSILKALVKASKGDAAGVLVEYRKSMKA